MADNPFKGALDNVLGGSGKEEEAWEILNQMRRESRKDLRDKNVHINWTPAKKNRRLLQILASERGGLLKTAREEKDDLKRILNQLEKELKLEEEDKNLVEKEYERWQRIEEYIEFAVNKDFSKLDESHSADLWNGKGEFNYVSSKSFRVTRGDKKVELGLKGIDGIKKDGISQPGMTYGLGGVMEDLHKIEKKILNPLMEHTEEESRQEAKLFEDLIQQVKRTVSVHGQLVSLKLILKELEGDEEALEDLAEKQENAEMDELIVKEEDETHKLEQSAEEIEELEKESLQLIIQARDTIKKQLEEAREIQKIDDRIETGRLLGGNKEILNDLEVIGEDLGARDGTNAVIRKMKQLKEGLEEVNSRKQQKVRRDARIVKELDQFIFEEEQYLRLDPREAEAERERVDEEGPGTGDPSDATSEVDPEFDSEFDDLDPESF